MPTVKRTEFTGVVEWLGMAAAGQESLCSTALQAMALGFDGLSGARHQGENRGSCVRVKNLYPEGTEIRNVRQLTILSAEELAGISAEIGLEAVDPGLIGASIILRGIPDFTHVPPAARLQGPSGVTLTIDMENRPCVYPAQEIEAENQGHGKGFLAAAKGRRGVTAWVERPGALSVGDEMQLFVPDQRGWQPEG